MTTITINAAIERRARQMYENQRRGAQLFIQWPMLSDTERRAWIDKAIADGNAIAAKLEAERGVD